MAKPKNKKGQCQVEKSKDKCKHRNKDLRTKDEGKNKTRQDSLHILQKDIN
jgi:hypothetical protein